MAETTLRKNANGYNYKYTDLAEIHAFLESKGWSYYQYIDVVDGNDYIMTVCIKDGKEETPKRGCRVVQATLKGTNNPAQEQGSAITYARRYSVLMAFGLCTSDDDAACMSTPKNAPALSKADLMNKVESMAEIKGVSMSEIMNISKYDKFEDFDEEELKGCLEWLKTK